MITSMLSPGTIGATWTTQLVAQMAPNQMGIYHLSGTVWDSCRDTFSCDQSMVPAEGAPQEDRVLRGGCFLNWAIRCTVAKRYEIALDIHDRCIGLRFVLAPPLSKVRRGT